MFKDGMDLIPPFDMFFAKSETAPQKKFQA
jgi:hypothetical protein